MAPRFSVPHEETFRSLQAFEAFAASFARALLPGDVVALTGKLGAGKTTFVRAAVRALHGEDQTSSPTFTFWHRYRGDPPLDHIDLYRLNDPSELRELGLDDAFNGGSIVFVEWWSHGGTLLPTRRYEVAIDGAGEMPRTVRVS